MGLKNIHLPGIVLHNLFKDCIVDFNNIEYPTEANEKIAFDFFGNNTQHIALLVDHEREMYLDSIQEIFLGGILNACKLSLSDVALINLAKHTGLKYQELNLLNARIIIMFGVLSSAIKLPFNIPHFQVQSFNQQIYLSAPSLNILQNDKELKRKLWTSLKQIFSL